MWSSWLEKNGIFQEYPVDYICKLTGHLVTKFFLFGKTKKTRHIPHMTSIFWTVRGARISMTESFWLLRFRPVSSTFIFDHMTWSPNHTSPLGSFWTPKALWITEHEDEEVVSPLFQSLSIEIPLISFIGDFHEKTSFSLILLTKHFFLWHCHATHLLKF